MFYRGIIGKFNYWYIPQAESSFHYDWHINYLHIGLLAHLIILN